MIKEVQVEVRQAIVPSSVNATITYHSYDPASGWVTFRIVNNVGASTLESARIQIINRTTNANYFGPMPSNSPFSTSPTQTSAGESSLAAGQTRYLRVNLSSKPIGVHCRATITLYTANDGGGSSSVKTVDFDLPAVINATITYHSYDAATGTVVFRIVNNAGGATLGCVKPYIVNRTTNAVYNDWPYLDTPFFTSPTQTGAGGSSLAAGQTGYLRFVLNGKPHGVPCRATITLYTADSGGGTSSVKTLDFNLP